MRAHSNVDCLGCSHKIEIKGTYDPNGTQGIILDNEHATNVCAEGILTSSLGKVIEGSVVINCSNCGLQNRVTLLFN